MFVDSHCHLDYDVLQNDFDGVLARAKNAGVEAMLSISTRLSTFDKVLSTAEKHPHIWASFGVHPHEVAEEGVIDIAEALHKVAHPKVVGIGETGLDFFYEHSPRALQEESFLAHIDLSKKSGLPLIIHTREAETRTYALLKEASMDGKLRGLIHCFTSSADFAKKCLDLGLSISISGIVTFKKATDLQDIVKALPLDRLLIETDSPYLAPVPFRGKSNEPSYVYHTAIFIAALKGMSLEELGARTTENFYRLFNKALPNRHPERSRGIQA